MPAGVFIIDRGRDGERLKKPATGSLKVPPKSSSPWPTRPTPKGSTRPSSSSAVTIPGNPRSAS